MKKQQYEKVFSFKNNFVNRFIIRRLKKALNNETYRIRTRARKKNRTTLNYVNFCRDVHLKDADSFALYLDDKRIEQARERRRQQYAVEQALKRFK